MGLYVSLSLFKTVGWATMRRDTLGIIGLLPRVSVCGVGFYMSDGCDFWVLSCFTKRE